MEAGCWSRVAWCEFASVRVCDMKKSWCGQCNQRVCVAAIKVIERDEYLRIHGAYLSSISRTRRFGRGGFVNQRLTQPRAYDGSQIKAMMMVWL